MSRPLLFIASGTWRSDDAHGLQPSTYDARGLQPFTYDAGLRPTRRHGDVHRQTHADQEVPPSQAGSRQEEVSGQEEEEESENVGGGRIKKEDKHSTVVGCSILCPYIVQLLSVKSW